MHPNQDLSFGGIPATTHDIDEAVAWLRSTEGDHAPFTQAMDRSNNPLADWARKDYPGLKTWASARIPSKPMIAGYLRRALMAARDLEESVERTAWATVQNKGGQGFSVDQNAKVAVEMLAMDAARRHFKDLGWVEEPDEIDAYRKNPFDLILRRGEQIKHVEVKGTTEAGTKVFLTPNEVRHAQQCEARLKCQSTALFVLTNVNVIKDGTESPIATGGNPLLCDPWVLAENRLECIAYSYLAECHPPSTPAS